MTRTRRILTQVKGEGMKAELLRGGAGSLAIAITSTAVGLLVTIVLARALGPSSYGIYVYVLATVSFLAVPAEFGISTLVLRETAKAASNGEWGLMRGLWHFSTLITFSIVIILTLGALVIISIFADRLPQGAWATFLWGMALVPLVTLGKLRGAALRGLGRIIEGQLPDTAIRSTLLLAFLVAATLFSPPKSISATSVMMLHVLAAALAFIAGGWLLYRARPTPLRAGPNPVYQFRAWKRAIMPLALLPAVQYIKLHTDVVMLGMFRTAADVGVYAVAAKASVFVALGLNAVNMVAAPYFARFHAGGEPEKLERLAVLSARTSFILALPMMLLFLLFGREILDLVFGQGFERGAVPLSILATGQVVHAALGMPGVLLTMADYAGDTLRANLLGAAANVLFNLALIPPFGAIGACTATLMAMLIWKGMLWRLVWIRLGCDSSFVGMTRKRY